jgi:hypothetical protein
MKKVWFTILVLFLVAGLTQAQNKGSMGVSVQAGIALPTGDFGDAYDMGFGGRGLFMYYLNKNMAVTGTAGYFTWSGKDEWDATFSTIPVLAGSKYFMGKGDFKPYVSGQLGMYFSSFEVEVDLGPFGGTQTVDDSGYDFGIALGGGFLLPVGKTMNLDVSAEYDIIFTEGSSTSNLVFLAGLAFAL